MALLHPVDVLIRPESHQTNVLMDPDLEDKIARIHSDVYYLAETAEKIETHAAAGGGVDTVAPLAGTLHIALKHLERELRTLKEEV